MITDFSKEVLNNIAQRTIQNDSLRKLGFVTDDNELCDTTYLIMIYNASLRMEIFNSEQRTNLNGLYHRLMYK